MRTRSGRDVERALTAHADGDDDRARELRSTMPEAAAYDEPGNTGPNFSKISPLKKVIKRMFKPIDIHGEHQFEQQE